MPKPHIVETGNYLADPFSDQITHHPREYQIIGSMFNGVRFTPSVQVIPNQRPDFIDGLNMLYDQNAILQSAIEAAAFRIASNGQSFERQITRTVALYFKQNGRLHAAFDDDSIPNENLLLLMADKEPERFTGKQEKNMENWMFPLDYDAVHNTIMRAREEERIVDLFDGSFHGYSRLSPTPSNTKKYFGDDEAAVAVFGDRMTNLYAQFRAKRRWLFKGMRVDSGYHPARLSQKIKDGTALLLVVYLGGNKYGDDWGVTSSWLPDQVGGDMRGRILPQNKIQRPLEEITAEK